MFLKNNILVSYINNRRFLIQLNLYQNYVNLSAPINYRYFYLSSDRPVSPSIKTYYATSKTIKLSWDHTSVPNAPVSGKNLLYTFL